MSGSNGHRKHATLYDFRDMDILVKLADAGGATSAEVADMIGLGDAVPMARRLAWMRHFGMLERDDEDGVWNLAPGGRRVVQARLKAAQTRTIEAIPDEALVDVMAHVTTRYRLGDPVMATLLRREFAYGTARR